MNKGKVKINITILLSILLFLMTILLISVSYLRINKMAEDTCWDRIEEAATVSIETFSQVELLEERILNGLATLIAKEGDINSDECHLYLRECSSMIPYAEIGVVTPTEQYIYADGTIRKIDEPMNFESLSARKNFVTEYRAENPNSTEKMLRHYVSVASGGEVKAVIYCSIESREIQDLISTELYGGKVSVYLVNKASGSYLVNSHHKNDDTAPKSSEMKGAEVEKIAELEKQLREGEPGRYVMIAKDGSGKNFIYHAPTCLSDYEFAISVPEKVAFYEVEHFHMVAISLVLVEITLLIIFFGWIIRKNRKAVDLAVQEERVRKVDANSRSRINFIANLSHDVRTPLNAILGFTSLARTNIDNKERLENYLNKISSTAQHLSQLINEVLNMMQITNGQMVLENSPTNLPNLAKELNRGIERIADSKKITVNVKLLNVSEENVYVDHSYLYKAIYNLLLNAIRHTPMGGLVELFIEQGTDRKDGSNNYIFSVKDTGIGVSEENLANIFDPLEHIYDATSGGSNALGMSNNTGLGLAIAKNIVEYMGGTIDVYSKKEDGTIFNIHLPLSTVKNPKDIEKALQVELIDQEGDLEGLRILLVEDNDLDREVSRELLEEWGVRVNCAENGVVALNMLRYSKANRYDLILMDIQMPLMNGFEATEQIRALPDKELSRIPIIAMTANSFDEDRQRALDCGMDAHMVKPIDMLELKSVITSLLK